jgi:hypothetical protein
MSATRMESEEIDRHLSVLEASQDRGEVQASAVALASSGDPAALVVLWRFLPEAEFLARLDDLGNPQLNVTGMSQVLKAMQANPSGVTGRICESLAWDADFLSEPDRKIFLLPALAAVRPMSRPAEAVFRAANAEGYFNSVGPLLVANGSPRALALFEEMVADSSQRPVDRVDMLHHAVLAHRTEGPVVAACLRLLARGLEPEVDAGVAETLYDYQEKRWFGPARGAPVPPPWNQAETAVLQALSDAAKGLRGPGRFSDDLQDAIEGTALEIRDILAARAA